MTSMQKFRDGDVGPIVILTAICVVIAVALAGIYQATTPVIAARQIQTANDVRQAVMPLSDSFSPIAGIPLPEGVDEAYKADNGTGFVFRSGAKGFNGTVVFMIGIDKDGAITGVNLFEHSETPGLGSKVGDAGYLQKYQGATDHTEIDGISGATKTSNALKDAITQAKQAYESVKEAA